MMVYDPKHDEGLTQFDRDLIGNSKRITIPLGDVYLMREIADLMRGLANSMDFHARRLHDIPERTALLQIKHEIDSTNRKIKLAAEGRGISIKEGRPTNRSVQERVENSSETDAQIDNSGALRVVSQGK